MLYIYVTIIYYENYCHSHIGHSLQLYYPELTSGYSPVATGGPLNLSKNRNTLVVLLLNALLVLVNAGRYDYIAHGQYPETILAILQLLCKMCNIM